VPWAEGLRATAVSVVRPKMVAHKPFRSARGGHAVSFA